MIISDICYVLHILKGCLNKDREFVQENYSKD